jgi:hypothetical protein
VRIAELKVVESAHDPRLKSLRGPKGRGHFDSPQEHVTAAGFEDGEDVVLISRADYERLVKATP